MSGPTAPTRTHAHTQVHASLGGTPTPTPTWGGEGEISHPRHRNSDRDTPLSPHPISPNRHRESDIVPGAHTRAGRGLALDRMGGGAERECDFVTIRGAP